MRDSHLKLELIDDRSNAPGTSCKQSAQGSNGGEEPVNDGSKRKSERVFLSLQFSARLGGRMQVVLVYQLLMSLFVSPFGRLIHSTDGGRKNFRQGRSPWLLKIIANMFPKFRLFSSQLFVSLSSRSDRIDDYLAFSSIFYGEERIKLTKGIERKQEI
jgi:hypothetical protein